MTLSATRVALRRSPWTLERLSLFVVALLLLTGGGAVPVSARDADEEPPIRLVRDTPLRMVLDVVEEPFKTFVVSIPSRARAMSIEVTDTPLAFDMYGRHEDSEEEFDHANDGFENRLWVTRDHEFALTPGTYYVHLDNSDYSPPYLRNRTVEEVPYTVLVRFHEPRVDGRLEPGEPRTATVGPDCGWVRTFTIEVPKRTQTLRIDLDGSRSDLDMRLRRAKPMLSFDDAEKTVMSKLGRDTLLVDRDSDPPLRSGRYYVDIVEPWQIDKTEFTVHASFEAGPPDALLGIPRLPVAENSMARAVGSSVEIFTSVTSGSGTIISPQGLVLTNEHVVADLLALREMASSDSGSSTARLDEAVIGVTLDPRSPSIAMFRGKIVDTVKEDDIALIQITSGYYGQPLPDGYRFPYVEFGEAEKLQFGDALRIVGYPSIGGLRNRPTVTMTEGSVSGFGLSDSGFLRIKTDAAITAGNSGGAALNDRWQLVGVPSMSVSDVELGLNEMGIVFSIDAVPEKWREMVSSQLSEGSR